MADMSARIFASVLLIVFIVAAVFGMYAMVAHPMQEGMECPFMPGGTALCALSSLAHLTLWQSAFTATLVTVLSMLVFLTFARPEFPHLEEKQRYRWRVRRTSLPATLFQELFSNGILNPKLF